MEIRKGRPKSEKSMQERLYIRVSKEEKEKIMSFSQENGYSLLELIRKGMDLVCKEK